MSLAALASGRSPGRLLGLDLARFVAIASMMAAHIVAHEGRTGATVHTVVDGRSSALFAVLAGVSLALATGRSTPIPFGEAAVGVLARAAIILAVGLTLGSLGSSIAVILVNYAVLFVAALAVIRLRTPALAGLAVAWAVLSPIWSFALRRLPLPGQTPGPVPAWLDVVHPLELATNVTLTGYYPVLTWFSYLLVGMALGRSRMLTRTAGALWCVGVGLVLWLGCLAVAIVLADEFGVLHRVEMPLRHPAGDLATLTAFYGTTPTTSWWWLATDFRHSGTTLDLLGTSGSALVVIGACLLLVRALGAAVVLLTPFVVAGSMPLSLYTAHVLIEVIRPVTGFGDTLGTWLGQVIALVVLALAYRAVSMLAGGGGRGPLESLTTAAARSAQESWRRSVDHRQLLS